MTSLRADITNWQTAPYSRWAFHHMRDILPTAPIPNDPADVFALQRAPRSFDEFSLSHGDGSSLDLEGFLKATATDAFVVLADGKIAYEFYDGGMEARTPHILMSMSKAFTGAVAGVMHHAGAIDLERAVADYVPEVAGTVFAGATVRQLLDMRTVVPLDEAQLRAYDDAVNWTPYSLDRLAFGLHAFVQQTARGAAPHGGPFSYISANTDLAGWVLERAGGQSFADLASEHLWRPIGAEDDASITLDRQGAARCAGGVSATALDIARLGQVMLDRGQRAGRAVLPEALIHDIARGGDRQAWRDGEWGVAFSFISPNMSYRSGWYTVDDEPQTLFAMGVHGQNLFIDPARRVVIVKLSSLASRIDYMALPLTHAAVPQITRIAAGTQA